MCVSRREVRNNETPGELGASQLDPKRKMRISLVVQAPIRVSFGGPGWAVVTWKRHISSSLVQRVAMAMGKVRGLQIAAADAMESKGCS